MTNVDVTSDSPKFVHVHPLMISHMFFSDSFHIFASCLAVPQVVVCDVRQHVCKHFGYMHGDRVLHDGHHGAMWLTVIGVWEKHGKGAFAAVAGWGLRCRYPGPFAK